MVNVLLSLAPVSLASQRPPVGIRVIQTLPAPSAAGAPPAGSNESRLANTMVRILVSMRRSLCPTLAVSGAGAMRLNTQTDRAPGVHSTALVRPHRAHHSFNFVSDGHSARGL